MNGIRIKHHVVGEDHQHNEDHKFVHRLDGLCCLQIIQLKPELRFSDCDSSRLGNFPLCFEGSVKVMDVKLCFNSLGIKAWYGNMNMKMWKLGKKSSSGGTLKLN